MIMIDETIIKNLEEAGYVIVPRETTGKMRSAAYDTVLRGAGEHVRLSGEDVIDLWDAMVTAAMAEDALESHES